MTIVHGECDGDIDNQLIIYCADAKARRRQAHEDLLCSRGFAVI